MKFSISHQNLNLTKENLYLLITIWANTSGFIILGTINIWTVIETTVTFFYWSTSALVEKMPMEASERAVLCALVLHKKGTLLSTKLFQIPVKNK